MKKCLELSIVNLSAWVGAKFDANRRGKKRLKSCRDKNEGMYRRGKGGGKGLISGPGSELRLLIGKEK